MKQDHHTGRLIISLIACLIPGYIALYLFTTSIPGWYSGLKKPGFLPSDLMVFYALILLFCLLGLSLYSIWCAGLDHNEVKAALRFFVFTLTLLMLWFASFFFLQAIFFAFVIMVMVIAMILCTLAQILRSAVTAAFFIVPCLILMIIIGYANLMIVELNAGLPAWGIIP
ncbi:TspO and MBR like protein [Methanoregula boonei 6A8]|uniref:TspO and MBR like protein n=1 Tax=Methanoregula boonei (strain DSM 21154 / JCM 14090 / 6A8) TaxID=456442 RepID=A7IA40_METB6|nr:TspO/MBR family protein [Methanoregula boonei]ABS56601.1 TspO and MBR like protein [Methanoregula boonei 6A8]